MVQDSATEAIKVSL